MTQIAFTYDNQSITLDASVGKIVGDKKVVKKITDIVDKYVGTTLGGEPWMPFDAVNIREPYKYTDQFAICLFYATLDSDTMFPAELDAYLPYHQSVDVDDLMVVY